MQESMFVNIKIKLKGDNKMNFFDVSEKVVVITGGSSGIGYGLAQVFAEAGSKVVIVNRNKKNGESAVNSIKKKGGKAISISTDVVNKNEVKEMFKEVVDMFGRVDLVISPAGNIIRKDSLELSEEEWHTQIDIDLKGVYNSSVEAAPYMIKQRWGKIINISSSCAERVWIHTPTAYAATKGGVVMMSKGLAIEYIPYNINVNVICPGYFETSINEEYRRVHPEEYKKIKSHFPQGRAGDVRGDLGGLCLFLASNASQGMIGQVIFVDQGVTVGDSRWGTETGLPLDQLPT